MNMKKGITMSVVMIAIVIMLVLISSASVIGSSALKQAHFDEFKMEVSRVRNNVNEYFVKNNELPTRNEIVSLNSLDEDLKKELEKNGDISDDLFVVDINKIEDPTITLGRESVDTGNVFIVAKKTQNIYYLKGYEFKKVKYYGA